MDRPSPADRSTSNPETGRVDYADASPSRREIERRRDSYPALASEPTDTAIRLADRLDLPPDPAHRNRIAAVLAAQHAGRRAPPPRVLDAEGYDHATVLAEPRIARYCARFEIEPERERLTGR